MKVIAICSGGLDSTVLYYYLLSKGHEVFPLNFSYGSKHNQKEIEAARKLFNNLIEIDIDLSFLHSSLLNKNLKIPKGHYESKTMKSTVVPFRNAIMLSYAIAYAESKKYDAVAIGNHGGDHAIYPDCRIDFIQAMNSASQAGTYKNIQILSPFVYMTKAEIVKTGKKLGIEKEMGLTWSCYKGKEKHCGACGTCVERKEAFELSGIKDLTEYA
jgi:7-cyano-7-deazaguanine synthase